MPDVDVARTQRRTLRLLFGTQIFGGVGTTIGVSVGGLLAARLGGTEVSGVAQSCSVIGAALLAVPVSRLMARRGRRPGLIVAYLVGALGAALVVASAAVGSIGLMFAGMLMFGGGSTANLQARYAAVDLSPAQRRARQMSVIVWASTIGGVTAPNLADPADTLAHRLGAPALTGPFVVSMAVYLLAGLVIGLLLRPDPLLTAQRLTAASGTADPVADARPAAHPDRRGGLRVAMRVLAANPGARLAVGAVATGHMIMVGVMSMTPVHIGMAGMAHGDADTLRLVGLVLSVHVAGMYALSPLVGLATDRYGRRPVILAGIAILVASCAFAGTAGESEFRLTFGLALLGFGWSCLVVAGSTLLTESVDIAVRPAVQGLSDLVMGVAGAVSGALSGLVVAGAGYPTLTLIAAIAVVPLLALALRPAVVASPA